MGLISRILWLFAINILTVLSEHTTTEPDSSLQAQDTNLIFITLVAPTCLILALIPLYWHIRNKRYRTNSSYTASNESEITEIAESELPSYSSVNLPPYSSVNKSI